MQPGQYTVHRSQQAGAAPTCVVGDSLPEAEIYARQQIEQVPTLRCCIYDHQDFINAPVQEIAGANFKGRRDLSPRVRRWLGLLLLGSARPVARSIGAPVPPQLARPGRLPPADPRP